MEEISVIKGKRTPGILISNTKMIIIKNISY